MGCLLENGGGKSGFNKKNRKISWGEKLVARQKFNFGLIIRDYRKIKKRPGFGSGTKAFEIKINNKRERKSYSWVGKKVNGTR